MIHSACIQLYQYIRMNPYEYACTWCVMYAHAHLISRHSAMRRRVQSASRKPNHSPLHRPHRKASCWAAQLGRLKMRHPQMKSVPFTAEDIPHVLHSDLIPISYGRLWIYLSLRPDSEPGKTMQPGLHILCLSARPVQNQNHRTWNHGVMYHLVCWLSV